MAHNLLLYGRYPMFDEEPQHCAVSMLVTVEQLYKARTEIARLRARYEPSPFAPDARS